VKNAKSKYGTTALMVAAGEGHTDIVERLLKAGADVNAKNKYGSTALIEAGGYTAIVERLLGVPGIDVNAKDKDGRTALDRAVIEGETAIVERLMAHNAEIARAIARPIRSRQRKRPRELHWAVTDSKRQKYDIVDTVAEMLHQMNLG
jgi:ankyrin repeat protein